jgi:hypothetical protein
MKPIDVFWTPRVNWLKVECCGEVHNVRVDHWWWMCPECKRRWPMHFMRDELVKREHGKRTKTEKKSA